MPCSDGGRDYGRVELRDNPKVKERLDRATRILCGLLKQMTHEEIILQSDETQVWWAKHQVEDHKREVAEIKAEVKRKAAAAKKREKTKQRKAGLAKLSSKEREALGL